MNPLTNLSKKKEMGILAILISNLIPTMKERQMVIHQTTNWLITRMTKLRRARSLTTTH